MCVYNKRNKKFTLKTKFVALKNFSRLPFFSNIPKSVSLILHLYSTWFTVINTDLLFLSPPPPFCLPHLQGRSVRSTSTGWRLRSRQWCWTVRLVRASWGPAAWWTASCRRNTPSSSRLTTAALAPVARRARSPTSEYDCWNILLKYDRTHNYMYSTSRSFPDKEWDSFDRRCAFVWISGQICRVYTKRKPPRKIQQAIKQTRLFIIHIKCLNAKSYKTTLTYWIIHHSFRQRLKSNQIINCARKHQWLKKYDRFGSL